MSFQFSSLLQEPAGIRYSCAVQQPDGTMRVGTISEANYEIVLDILAMSQQILDYYHALPVNEDAIDHTYQYFQRVLNQKSWYNEKESVLRTLIMITKQYVLESHILTDYYDYLLYCLAKEKQKQQEVDQAVLQANHIAH